MISNPVTTEPLSETLVVATDSQQSSRDDRAQLMTLSAGHAVIDSYGHTLLAPMFPVIAARLDLGLDQIGALPLMMGLTASLAQPLIGLATDRWPRIPAVALGPAVAAVFVGLVSFAPSYAALAACMFLAGIGIGAYHPQGASLASAASRGRGLAMSTFTVGGNIGFGVAPLLGAIYYKLFGLERFYLAAVPGLVFAVWMLVMLRRPENRLLDRAQAHGSNGDRAGDPVALALLTGTVAVRAGVQIATGTFLAFLLHDRAPDLGAPWLEATDAAAISMALYLLATAVSGPIGGHLADRFGRRAIMTVSLAVAPFVFYAALKLDGWFMVAGLAAGGFVLVMAAEYMPRSAGVAASMITGLAWAIGQFLSWPLGILAKRVGVEAALGWVYWLPLVGILLVLPLRTPRQQNIES
jgi:FSR family fosmidomycin resistance protein-like MFS transporter